MSVEEFKDYAKSRMDDKKRRAAEDDIKRDKEFLAYKKDSGLRRRRAWNVKLGGYRW